MSIKKTQFGEYKGQPVYLYTLDNGNGLSAQIMNYGGIIRRLVYKGTDVVLGRESFEDYLENYGYFGAIIGRNANRIGNAQVTIDNITYKLSVNQHGNNLHGGKEGFDKKLWNAQCVEGEEPALQLTLVSPDGDEGYPGEVKVTVTYTLTADNSLKIHYEGEADRDSILNLTNHSYFNLNGHGSGTIEKHSLWLKSSFYTPNTKECQPNGEILSVKNTPFDFTSGAIIGERLHEESEQLAMFYGFDHNFVLDGAGYRLAAELTGDESKIVMRMYTDRPGMQLCGGNYVKEGIYKDGRKYQRYSGLCLETQAFPSWNLYSHFPGGILCKGEKYDTTTAFKFL